MNTKFFIRCCSLPLRPKEKLFHQPVSFFSVGFLSSLCACCFWAEVSGCGEGVNPELGLVSGSSSSSSSGASLKDKSSSSFPSPPLDKLKSRFSVVDKKWQSVSQSFHKSINKSIDYSNLPSKSSWLESWINLFISLEAISEIQKLSLSKRSYGQNLCCENELHSHENKKHSHINGFALCLALKQRLGATQKRPIKVLHF